MAHSDNDWGGNIPNVERVTEMMDGDIEERKRTRG
jgi:hypothetical protein